MGIIQSGILSKVSGKVAGVVGADWKGIAYLRAYTKPANPNTAAQQVQRTKFSDTVEFAVPILGQVLQEYVDPFEKKMSGYNKFIQRNIDIFDGSPAWGSVVLTQGTLSSCIVSAATYSGDTVAITYTENDGNNGLSSDKVYALVHDETTNLFYFAAAEAQRDTTAINVTCENGLTAGNLFCFLITSRLVGTTRTMVGRSSHLQVTV